MAKLKKKEAKRKAKATAVFEEETRAKRKATKKAIEEGHVVVKEEVVKVDSKRNTLTSFDTALDEAFEQASVETPREEEERPPKPQKRR